MFSRSPSIIDLELERAVRELKNHPIGSEEYNKTLEVIIKLHRMRSEETSDPVSKDTVALIAANLLGIVMVIRHEHVNVIVSRAMGMVMRPR